MHLILGLFYWEIFRFKTIPVDKDFYGIGPDLVNLIFWTNHIFIIAASAHIIALTQWKDTIRSYHNTVRYCLISLTAQHWLIQKTMLKMCSLVTSVTPLWWWCWSVSFLIAHLNASQCWSYPHTTLLTLQVATDSLWLINFTYWNCIPYWEKGINGFSKLVLYIYGYCMYACLYELLMF